MAAVGELWVSWFTCCVTQPQKRRHRIDRSMIGEPTNFQHTAHIGSRDVEMPNDQLTALQMQMKSKGGYETTYKVGVKDYDENSNRVMNLVDCHYTFRGVSSEPVGNTEQHQKHAADKICLEKGPKLMPIFDQIKPPHFSILIMACASVQVIEGDGLPPYICQKCITRLHIAFQFKTQCESSDAKLRQCFENLTHMPSTPDLSGFIEIKRDVVCFDQNSLNDNRASNATNQGSGGDPLVIEAQSNEEQENSMETNQLQILQNVQLDPGSSLQDIEKNDLSDLKLELNDLKPAELDLKAEDISMVMNGLANPKPKMPQKQHQCDTCGKVLRTKPGLINHIRIHTGERPYVCHLCDKRFINGGHLHTHMRTHTGEKNHICAACSKAFATAQQLTKHTIAIHTSERPYACTYCPKRFASSSNLSTHTKIHTGEKNYHCDQCGKTFSTKGQLYQHMLVHTGEKAFLCEYCNKRFSQKAHLIRHSKMHKN